MLSAGFQEQSEQDLGRERAPVCVQVGAITLPFCGWGNQFSGAEGQSQAVCPGPPDCKASIFLCYATLPPEGVNC